MYNKVLVPNPRYNRLKMSAGLLMLFALLYVAVLIVGALLGTRNFNGDVTEITGKVTFVGEESDTTIVELDGDKHYTAGPIETKTDDWSALTDKNVTLYIPARQLKSTYPWIIGIKTEEGTIVDYQTVLEEKRAENRTMMIIVGVLTGVFVLASAAIYAWQKKTPPTTEKELAAAYCEYSASRQPSSPAYRKAPYITLAYFVLFLICASVMIISEELIADRTISVILDVCTGALLAIATIIYIVLFAVWLPKKEREYYAANFPFDFTDISHVAMRKKIKRQLQEELKAEREAFPHRYGDGGNGYLCDFTEEGVSLSVEYPDETEFAPSAEEVFGEGGDAPVTNHHLCDLSYEELNFEAVPYYRKRDRSLFIVIKSRLQSADKFPETMDIVNDIHILLDSNLLATLRRFNVNADNLDYLLNNKKALIEENCRRSVKRNK